VLSASLISAMRSPAFHYLGRLDEADADAREALRTAETYGATPIASWAAVPLGWALVSRGEFDEAEEVLARPDVAAAIEETFIGLIALRTRAQLRTEQGRLEEAVADLRQCERRLAAWQVDNPALVTWRNELAVVEHLLGHEREAAELATEQLDKARAWGAPWLVAQSLRVAGSLAGEERGEEMLREAVEAADAGAARLEKARALVELGALLRRSGSRQDSREPLRQGLDLALVCGARPVAERAHEELVASGAQPRRLRESGPDALTPAERRVAGMAADGMTNRAIAQSLFVSEKTVETHLRSVFRKLDIGSRSQIADRLSSES
jgi:ATP/maltotriose-dependent transcriptional regulator MalT